MPDSYKDFQREPSKSHQCMHESDKDGTRCRAMSMQNNYMCYAHRTDDVVTVVENDMFLIDKLDTHEAIQKVFLDVAARLACNHIDLKRAELLITLLRAASRNLRDAATARRQAPREAAGAGAGAPQLDSAMWVPHISILRCVFHPRPFVLMIRRPPRSTPMRKRTSSNAPPPAPTTRPSTA